MKGMDKAIYIAVVLVMLLIIVVISVLVASMAQGSVVPIGEQLKNLIGWQ